MIGGAQTKALFGSKLYNSSSQFSTDTSVEATSPLLAGVAAPDDRAKRAVAMVYL
jgi:hypothetical protein